MSAADTAQAIGFLDQTLDRIAGDLRDAAYALVEEQRTANLIAFAHENGWAGDVSPHMVAKRLGLTP